MSLGQATLEIQNNSGRTMLLEVMIGKEVMELYIKNLGLVHIKMKKLNFIQVGNTLPKQKQR